MGTHSAEAELARRLIRAPSVSCAESPAAAALQAALEELGFAARRDDAGNVIGTLALGAGPTVMFNGHIDVVPVGDEDAWPHPPLGGEIVDGLLWGRGAVDMKGPLAAMTLGARDAADRGFAGTLLVTGVVQEELGGLGARHLATHTTADLVVIGEPSRLGLMLGHRGRVEIDVELPGRIAHAARNELGANALYRAAAWLAALEDLELPAGDTLLGGSSATPTRLHARPDARNVVPGEAVITIDYRNIPGDEPDAILRRLRAIDPQAVVSIPTTGFTSETGLVSENIPLVGPSWRVAADHPAIEVTRRAAAATLAGDGIELREGAWWFATDAPYLAAGGTPVVGFGPGDPELAHTTRECVPLDELAMARRVYAEIALAFSRRFEEQR